MSTHHPDGEVVVDDVVRDVLHHLVDGLRLVPLLVIDADPPPVQLGRPGLGDALRELKSN